MLSQAKVAYNEPTLSVEKLFLKFSKDVAVEAITRQLPDGNFKRLLQGASLVGTLSDLILDDQKGYDALSAALKIGTIIYDQLVKIQLNRC